MKRVLFIFGTRPEAIKLCPVIRHMRRHAKRLQVRVCVTAQHRGMLDQVLDCFEVRPDCDLDLMQPGQTLAETTARVLTALDPVLLREAPAMAVVQGDTTTTMAGAMAAFYRRIPVAHVEAGLRTGDLFQPFPEEFNRLVATRVTALHFAPTEWARRNLLAEGVPEERILVTGNSGIDAILEVAGALRTGPVGGARLALARPKGTPPASSSWSRPTAAKVSARASSTSATHSPNWPRGPDVQIVYPVHRNPNVLDPVTRRLEGHPHIVLTEPLDYVSFVDLMRRAYLIVTDSGGIQEEAPSLGKPVLVLRERTERPEAVEAGTVKLVGSDPGKIATEAAWLLDDPAEYQRRSRIHNPYGDGHASERITEAMERYLGR